MGSLGNLSKNERWQRQETEMFKCRCLTFGTQICTWATYVTELIFHPPLPKTSNPHLPFLLFPEVSICIRSKDGEAKNHCGGQEATCVLGAGNPEPTGSIRVTWKKNVKIS